MRISVEAGVRAVDELTDRRPGVALGIEFDRGSVSPLPSLANAALEQQLFAIRLAHEPGIGDQTKRAAADQVESVTAEKLAVAHDPALGVASNPAADLR